MFNLLLSVNFQRATLSVAALRYCNIQMSIVDTDLKKRKQMLLKSNLKSHKKSLNFATGFKQVSLESTLFSPIR